MLTGLQIGLPITLVKQKPMVERKMAKTPNTQLKAGHTQT